MAAALQSTVANSGSIANALGFDLARRIFLNPDLGTFSPERGKAGFRRFAKGFCASLGDRPRSRGCGGSKTALQDTFGSNSTAGDSLDSHARGGRWMVRDVGRLLSASWTAASMDFPLSGCRSGWRAHGRHGRNTRRMFRLVKTNWRTDRPSYQERESQ